MVGLVVTTPGPCLPRFSLRFYQPDFKLAACLRHSARLCACAHSQRPQSSSRASSPSWSRQTTSWSSSCCSSRSHPTTCRSSSSPLAQSPLALAQSRGVWRRGEDARVSCVHCVPRAIAARPSPLVAARLTSAQRTSGRVCVGRGPPRTARGDDNLRSRRRQQARGDGDGDGYGQDWDGSRCMAAAHRGCGYGGACGHRMLCRYSTQGPSAHACTVSDSRYTV